MKKPRGDSRWKKVPRRRPNYLSVLAVNHEGPGGGDELQETKQDGAGLEPAGNQQPGEERSRQRGLAANINSKQTRNSNLCRAEPSVRSGSEHNRQTNKEQQHKQQMNGTKSGVG